MSNITSSHIDLTVTQSSIYRLDAWLSDHLADFSRSRLQKLIEEGCVFLNEKICLQKKTMLKIGDRLKIQIPEVKPSTIPAENIPLDILYEDEQLLIINKQKSLVVHPAPGHYNGTLVNALLYHCPNLEGIGGIERPGIVHRLDKDTTGAIMVAKTELALHNLQAQIKAKTARREYLGIVYGCPKQDNGVIHLPIGRHPGDRQKMTVLPVEKGGREAVTHWQVQERLGNYCLLHFCLETGRTHQIRVHSSHIKHPLVGDTTYSNNHFKAVNLQGQALHAYKLTVTHPLTQQEIVAIAPIPVEFAKLLTALRGKLGY